MAKLRPKVEKRKRRESDSTRRRRQQIAKDRQGVNGKWESNAKKAAARAARRKTLGLGTLFKSAMAKHASLQEKSLSEAQRHVKELRTVADSASLTGIIADLEKLPVNIRLLSRTRLPVVLQEALRRVTGADAVRERAARLRNRWRDEFRKEKAKSMETSQDPSVVVAKLAQEAKGLAAAVAERGLKRRASGSASSSSSSDSSDSSAASSAASVEHVPLPAQASAAVAAGAPPARQAARPTKAARKPARQSTLTAFMKPALGA